MIFFFKRSHLIFISVVFVRWLSCNLARSQRKVIEYFLKLTKTKYTGAILWNEMNIASLLLKFNLNEAGHNHTTVALVHCVTRGNSLSSCDGPELAQLYMGGLHRMKVVLPVVSFCRLRIGLTFSSSNSWKHSHIREIYIYIYKCIRVSVLINLPYAGFQRIWWPRRSTKPKS